MPGCLEASWLSSILQRSILSHPCVQFFFFSFFVSCYYRDFLLILPPIWSYYECSECNKKKEIKRKGKTTSWKGRRTIFVGPPSIPSSVPSNGASKRRRVGAKCLLSCLFQPSTNYREREPAFTIFTSDQYFHVWGGCCCCCYLTRCMIRDHSSPEKSRPFTCIYSLIVQQSAGLLSLQ